MAKRFVAGCAWLPRLPPWGTTTAAEVPNAIGLTLGSRPLHALGITGTRARWNPTP